MQYGPLAASATDEAEYYVQELRAQRQRAKLLFHCYLEEEEPAEDLDTDDYSAFYEEDAH